MKTQNLRKNLGGRPAHNPTQRDRGLVEMLAGFGIPQAQIREVVGVSLSTLNKHYREELDAGAAQVEAKLVGNLMQIAEGNDGTALKAIIFTLNCRFGWSDPGKVNVGKKATLEQKAGQPNGKWRDVLQ